MKTFFKKLADPYNFENYRKEIYHFSRKLSKIKPLLNALTARQTINAGSLKKREPSENHQV